MRLAYETAIRRHRTISARTLIWAWRWSCLDRPDAALREFRDTVRLDPIKADAYYNEVSGRRFPGEGEDAEAEPATQAAGAHQIAIRDQTAQLGEATYAV